VQQCTAKAGLVFNLCDSSLIFLFKFLFQIFFFFFFEFRASEVVASEVKKSIFDGCAIRLGVSVLSGNRLPLGVPILSEYCLSYLD